MDAVPGRTRRRLGDAGGLQDFGYVLLGELTLVEDGGVGSRNPADLATCSDVDMMSSNADGRFVHKDGTPYP